MDKERLIKIIENGWQIGINKFVDENFVYTYAIQKFKEKYIVYIDECNLDEMYFNEDDDIETVNIYDNISDVLDNFNARYDISFENLNVSKGHKFFNPQFYL